MMIECIGGKVCPIVSDGGVQPPEYEWDGDRLCPKFIPPPTMMVMTDDGDDSDDVDGDGEDDEDDGGRDRLLCSSLICNWASSLPINYNRPS